MKPERTPAATPATKPRRRTTTELRELGAQPGSHPMMAELYRRAEAQVRKLRQGQGAAAPVRPATADPQRLLHELQVHQVELELQNEELRKVRDRLEAGLEKYSDLYDFAPVGYFTLAADGTIQQVNLTGASLAGMERSRLLGQPFGVLVVAELLPVFNVFLERVFAGPAKHSCEVTLGSTRRTPRAVNLEAQRSATGLECHLAVVDITEHKAAEDQVRASEVRYRRLFEATHDGVLLLDPATRKITDANPFMTKLLGYSHDQLLGKELFEIGLLKDAAASDEMFRKLKRKHEVRYEDLPLASRRGRHQEVEVVANRYQENGHAVIQCNVRDITARKKTEQELAEKARLLDLSQDAIIVRDLAGRIRYWNHGAEALYGWSREEALGKISHRLLRTEYPTPLKQITAELLRANRWIGELVHTKRDGQRITVLVRKTLDRDRQGRPAAVLQTITDITARKQAAEAQRRLEVLTASHQKLAAEIVRRQAVEATLRHSEQQQRRLLAEARQLQEQLRQLSRQVLRAQEEERKRISRELHDVLAQTLAGINVRLAHLQQEAARNPTGLAAKLARTQRLVEKAVALVHRFARELRPTMLDDLGLIPALHAILKSFTTRTGVRASLTAFAAVEQLDPAARTVLYRVTQEALTNVAKHAHASRVAVILQKLPAAVRLEIKDDGKSFQVDRVLHAQKGRRLGLLGMRERVEMVGGKFAVASAPGQGTTIQVELPFPNGSGGKGS